MTDSPHNNNNVVVREGSSGRIFRWENLQDSEKTRFDKYLSDQNLTTRDHLDHFMREGVKFSEEGYPDFSPYARAEVVLPELAASPSTDSARAYKVLYGANEVPSEMRDNYTWHHVEDTKRMQLVPK